MCLCVVICAMAGSGLNALGSRNMIFSHYYLKKARASFTAVTEERQVQLLNTDVAVRRKKRMYACVLVCVFVCVCACVRVYVCVCVCRKENFFYFHWDLL